MNMIKENDFVWTVSLVDDRQKTNDNTDLEKLLTWNNFDTESD